jgi:hypothetical protein
VVRRDHAVEDGFDQVRDRASRRGWRGENEIGAEALRRVIRSCRLVGWVLTGGRAHRSWALGCPPVDLERGEFIHRPPVLKLFLVRYQFEGVIVQIRQRHRIGACGHPVRPFEGQAGRGEMRVVGCADFVQQHVLGIDEFMTVSRRTPRVAFRFPVLSYTARGPTQDLAVVADQLNPRVAQTITTAGGYRGAGGNETLRTRQHRGPEARSSDSAQANPPPDTDARCALGRTARRLGSTTPRDCRPEFSCEFSCYPALVAQGIERRTPKPGVAGSNPAGGTEVTAHVPRCPRRPGLQRYSRSRGRA